MQCFIEIRYPYQKFLKNRLSDTRYHERLIKISMSGPAKIFFCPVMML